MIKFVGFQWRHGNVMGFYFQKSWAPCLNSGCVFTYAFTDALLIGCRCSFSNVVIAVLLNTGFGFAKIIPLRRYEYIQGIVFGIFEHIMYEVGNQKSNLNFSSYYQIRKNDFFSFLTSFYYIPKPYTVLRVLLSFTSVSWNKSA